VVPLLIGYDDPELVEKLVKRHAVESAKPRRRDVAISGLSPPETYMREEMIQALQDVLEVERVCRGLDGAAADQFRDFYRRLSQSLACAPTGFRDVLWGQSHYAATHMKRKASDKQFYALFFQQLKGSDLATRCVVSLYQQSDDPIDTDMLRAIAKGPSAKAAMARRVLQVWQSR